jgi:hypothetical protein
MTAPTVKLTPALLAELDAKAERGERRCGIQLGTAQGIARALGTTVQILQAESVVEALAEQRRETAKLLLGYRAVPYHGGRKKKKEAHCGDSVG